MEDREQLELAAKAAGIEGEVVPGDLYFRTRWYLPNGTRYWNPLTDDGDALRLAVKLGFSDGKGLSMFFADKDDPTVVVRKYDNTPGAMELVKDDPYAATRRAIVRAAAEIGKEMK